ncbi:F-box domain-containing protein [Emericellopsis atlantica]|uniref:F-box domain-containing protein n=1 Tax=Emericellopsis atlantica TaxID=2614577 RepID=A0A9P8CQ77_9HYPO|nr:F-box domain-containing protein [Emericellopsis atlantica]KAG9253456.1 F-box domain-containing protein [Emericellopsis atlantica]
MNSPTSPRRSRHHGHDLLARLPDQILVQILEMVSHISKRSLCQVSRLSKRYHAVADAILYKTLHFSDPELHLIFSQSLQRRPRRGSAIHEFKLAYPASELSQLMLEAPVHGSYYDQAPVRYDSLSRTISVMSNLETLDIAVPDRLLPGIGKLFGGPFDLACLRSCTLFYQTEHGEYWDLQENIHIFAHPTLETLVIKRAKLDHTGFDYIEQPHETALEKLHLIECDFNDDALTDILMFPKALTEFVMTQTSDPSPELEESSDRMDHYILALQSACHSLVTITIDFPTLSGHKALRMRDFEALKTLRINWDYQLFGKSTTKPRMHSVGLPPNLETLEFFNPLGTDDEVTDLLEYTMENIKVNAQHLRHFIVVDDEEHRVPRQVIAACRTQPQMHLDIIGNLDEDEVDD